MERRRKRVRVDAAATRVWRFHGDQQFVGACQETGVTGPADRAAFALTLVAAGERHVQIRSANDEDAAVGKLVALPPSGRWTLQQNTQGNSTRYYVAVPRVETETKVCVVDGASMDVHEVACPRGVHDPVGAIDAAFVDGTTGNAMVLVAKNQSHEGEADAWRLWCWRRAQEGDERADGSWTTRPGVLVARGRSVCAWDARFFTSSMFGPCVHLVGITSQSTEPQVLMIESRLVAVDDEWTLLHSHQSVVRVSSARSCNSQPRSWLSPSSEWVLVVSSGGNELVCLRVDPFKVTTNKPMQQVDAKPFGAPIADIAWHGEFFAVLLVDGSINILQLPQRKGDQLEIVQATRGDQTNDCLHLPDFSEVVASISTAWHRLVWIAERNVLFASSGAEVVGISISIEEQESGTVMTLDHSQSLQRVRLERHAPTGEHSLRKRRRRLGSPACTSQATRGYTDVSTLPLTTVEEIVASTRDLLVSNKSETIDAAFTLLGILLQRVLRQLGFLRDDQSVHILRYEDVPIQVGILEMLIAQVLTKNYPFIYLTASRVVQAPAFTCQSERQVYYKKEAHQISSAQPPNKMDAMFRRHFLACFTHVLTNELADAHSTGDIDLEFLNSSPKLSASRSVMSEGSQVLAEMERRTSKSGSCPARLRASAILALFNIVSDHCKLDRLEWNVSALAAALEHSKRMMSPREAYLDRFVTTAPSSLLLVDNLECRSRLARVVQGLAVQSGLLAKWVDFVYVSDELKLRELLHATRGPNDSLRSSQGISLEIVGYGIAQLESLLRASAFLFSCKSMGKTSASEDTKQAAYAEQDDAAMDSFVKLVFVASNKHEISDEILVSCIKSSCSMFEFDSGELELRSQVFKLAWVIMRHIRQVAVSLHGEEWSEQLPRLFSKLFMSNQLWSASGSSEVDGSPRAALHFLNENVLHFTHDSAIEGRVMGIRLNDPCHSTALGQRPLAEPYDRFVRSFALLLWSLWVRDRASRCKEAIEQYRDSADERDASTARKLGSIAASCALHFKALALFRDPSEEDEVVAAQLFFLEAAVEFNVTAAAGVVSWAFSSDSMNARHLRRFRGIQAAIAESVDPRISGVDQHWNALRRAVQQTRKSIHEVSVEVDIFATCCCERNFQRVVWALQQRRFTVVAAGSPTEEKTLIKKALQARPSSVEGLVSRHEVVNLLHAQRLEIEHQMERLRRNMEEHEVNLVRQSARDSTSSPQQTNENRVAAPAHAKCDDTQQVCHVRDLNPRHRSHESLRSASSTRNIAIHTDQLVLKKGTSAQNVLKLLQLRKESREIKRHNSTPQMVGVPVNAPLKSPSQEVQLSPRPNVTSGQPKRGQERVLPLRRDHPEHAELLLLTASNGTSVKTVPLSRRSFRLAIPTAASEQRDDDSLTQYASSAVQCTVMNTTSVQTEEVADTEPPHRESVDPRTRYTPVDEMTPEPIASEAPVLTATQATQYEVATDVRGVQDGKSKSRFSISNRFPVYVDLEPSAAGKFLHIARIKSDTTVSQREKDRVLVVRTRPPSPSSVDCNDREPSGSADVEREPMHPQKVDENVIQAEIQDRRRQTYHAHFPAPKNKLTRAASTRSNSSGVDSFNSLRSEMEQMKAKLQELENCARDLDDDFKVSHHRLETIDRTHRHPVVDMVENVIETTRNTSHSDAQGTLATKATRDLDSAKHLLAQIERLTTTGTGDVD